MADVHDSLAMFSAPTRAWFEASFPAPTPAQRDGWRSIAAGNHTLIHAPTGSGKTLAAFLATIDALLTEPLPDDAERCRVLYVSPMKALAYDIERNLRAPLAGIRHAADRLGLDPLPALTSFLRTGDTPADERRRMQRRPPDVLITTPESLYLLLTSQAREALRSVRWVICDEIHAIAGTKRGAHLALSLERLEEITTTPPQRIGLSATQRPLETIARFLGGGTSDGGRWTARPVEIIDTAGDRPLDLELIVPVDDMTEPAEPDPLEPDLVRVRSIWPAVYPRILELIRTHNSTIVFANSRRLAERVCAALNELAGEEIARAHHGSVSREQRVTIEEALKRGDLKAVVATSSLELGIDMGAVDLVVQIEAPNSVASGLQRVGRAGHQVGAVSKAKLFPKHRGDLLVSAVMVEEMVQRRIEPTRIPRNPLDVLSQQLVASVVIDEDRTVDDLFSMVTRAAPYAELPRSVFDATMDMLAGRYPSDLFSELRPRVVWNRADGSVTPRPGARQLAVANAGTIPDRGLYRVTLPDGTRVGELDEEMVYESRQGDVFVLGSSTWRISEISQDKVVVVPAPGEPAARMPYWHGDALGRSVETGRSLGRFIRELSEMSESAARTRLSQSFQLDDKAADNLLAYLAEQRETGIVPTDETIVIERFRDEIGDWRLVVLSPLGARVHAPWAMALTRKLRTDHDFDVDVIWSDDGIAFRFPDADEIPGAADIVLDPDEVEHLLTEHLADTAMFAARFREAASRALLLPRRRPGQRTPLWLQRRRAGDLMAVATRFGSFPIVLETYREILQDDFDLPALTDVLRSIASREIRIAEIDTPNPSPFASSLLFAFIAAFMYEGDTPMAERRAAALTLDRDLLRELLGEGELRQLLDPDLLTELELELQRLTDDRRVRGPDAIHDLLRTLGPLTTEQIDLRTVDTDVAAATETLAADRRVIEVMIGGVMRWAAIEDAARLRDALGVQPPQGVPHAFLEPVDDPLGDVVGRYARTHGPFAASAAGAELGLGVGVVTTVLERLETASRVTRGAFRPGGSGIEWVDTEVLKRIKRRSLAALRSEIEPVDTAAVGRFLPSWHGVRSDPPTGIGPLTETVRRLQGAEIPASVLENDVLARRVADAGPLLDLAMVRGDVVWAGRGSLGPRDGKLALYFRDQLATLWTPPAVEAPEGPLHDTIRAHLRERGASFFDSVYAAAGGGDPDEVLGSLWDLVWAGEVTNDTLDPVRALLRTTRRTNGKRPRRLGSTFPAHASGRWSAMSDLLGPASEASPTVRLTSWCDQLLDRHGVITRSTVTSEGFPGGFSALYPVLSHMEETGRVRRGYFVERLGGAQFALSGAVDRLRAETQQGIVLLASTDPANPYGGTLDWPRLTEGRIGRFVGTYVLLAEGALVAFLDGRRLRTFTDDDEIRRAAAIELTHLASRKRKTEIREVDGAAVAATPWQDVLVAAGFSVGPRGLVARR